MGSFGEDVGSKWTPLKCGWIEINADGAYSDGGNAVVQRVYSKTSLVASWKASTIIWIIGELFLQSYRESLIGWS